MKKKTAREIHLEKINDQLRKENKNLKEQVQIARKDAFRYHDELLMLRRKYEPVHKEPEYKKHIVAVEGVGYSGAGKTGYTRALMGILDMLELNSVVNLEPPSNAVGPKDMLEYLDIFKKDYPTQDK